MERFTEKWTQTYIDLINNDVRYKEHGSDWNNTIRFIATTPTETKAVWLNLVHGVCIKGCSGAKALEAKTEFEIKADEHTWTILLNTNSDPLVAIMTGKLKLTLGSLFTLSRHATSAKDLVRIASSITLSDEKTPYSSTKKKSSDSVAAPVNNEITTMKRRLNTDSFPYRLFEKAKVLGIWNPSQINLEQDKKDWETCSTQEKELILHLTSLFQSGEESVTNEIVPLLLAVSKEHRIEEELYLTSFLFEEAKHTDFFNRLISEVFECQDKDLDRFKGEHYIRLFDDKLNNAMRRLLADSSPKNQLLASVTYNMIVEGSLAETGYHAYYKMLEENNLMPGIRKGIHLLKQDESRHIAYGIYLISRILIEHPVLKSDFEHQMSDCLELVIGVIHEIFEGYESMPFGLNAEDFIDFATEQFQRRYERIEKSLENKTPFTELNG